MMAGLGVMALIFTACAGSSGGGSSATTPDGGQGGNDPVVKAGYYEELLAKPIGNCENVDQLQFQALANLQSEQFATDNDGKKLVVHLLLSLKADGTYNAVYSEQKVISATNTHVKYENLYSRNVTGRFQVENDTKLILENLGVANKLQIGDQKKVQLKITERIHDARVNSIFIVLEKTITTISPDGETAEQYCQRLQ